METRSKVKFENDKDFIDGTISMGEMLDTWQSTSDSGVSRSYTLTPNSSELSLEILLTAVK